MGELPDDVAALQQAGRGRFSDVRVFAEVDSTNTMLLAEAAAGAGDGTVVVADHQSAGRGRLGRTWNAAPGSALLVSVLVRPAVAPGRVATLTLMAGYEMAAAIDAECDAGVALKWPNDLRLGGRKLGGVLAEARTDAPGALVIGVGVNIRRGALPAEVAQTAVSLEEAGHDVARSSVLAGFLERLDTRLASIEAGGAGAPVFLEEYATRCETLGTEVRVRMHTTRSVVVEGTAVGVTPDGSLVVRESDGHEVAVGHGEVEQLR